ncbi:MAG: DDE transposase family protein [Mastigocoleus sp. MO_188.B34]|nr:DDE transposase family protein [Mastigocoleus sp. MO_188.B34]MDJ0698149.1 DDE transposase family protein [Mastigocoleus sp. MO_188.B34]
MIKNTSSWYIVKNSSGNCKIVPSNDTLQENESGISKQWGPFISREEAIVRRVGLIRTGKCKPT